VDVNVGGVVSAGETVTLKLADVERPESSVAVHVTVVSPTGKRDPGAGLQATVGVDRLSLAEGNP